MDMLDLVELDETQVLHERIALLEARLAVTEKAVKELLSVTFQLTNELRAAFTPVVIWPQAPSTPTP